MNTLLNESDCYRYLMYSRVLEWRYLYSTKIDVIVQLVMKEIDVKQVWLLWKWFIQYSFFLFRSCLQSKLYSWLMYGTLQMHLSSWLERIILWWRWDNIDFLNDWLFDFVALCSVACVNGNCTQPNYCRFVPFDINSISLYWFFSLVVSKVIRVIYV